MTGTTSRDKNRDQGAILPLVLVLVVILAVVATALATYTATALRASGVTSDIVDRLAASESGMQTALGRADAGTCDSTTEQLNGAVVTTTCERAVRVENADGLYALVVTGVGVTTHEALDTAGANNPQNALKRISGPIYLGQGITTDLIATAAVVYNPVSDTDVGGDVRFDVVGDCLATSPNPAPPTEWETPRPVVSCDSRGWEQVAPTLNFAGLTYNDLFGPSSPNPVPVGDPTNPLPTAVGGCKVYNPGRFDGTITPTLQVNSPSFFRSGIYYFHNVLIDLTADTAVGKRTGDPFPNPLAKGIHYPADCDTEFEDPLADASGAVFVLSGTSRIEGKGSNLDFYPRQIPRTNTVYPPADATVIALQGVEATNSGYAPTTLNPDAADNQHSSKLISRGNGSQTDMSFYGLIYAPWSWVDTGNASGSAFVEFIGGLVVARATIQTAANVDGFNIYVPSIVYQYFLIESTATLDGASTTTRSVSRLGAVGLDVISWRVT